MTRYVLNHIDFARSIICKIPNIEQLHAILIGGSVAKGWADEYSDLELCLCWKATPSIEIRRKIIELLDGKSKKVLEAEINGSPLIFEEGFEIEDTHVDFWHCTDAGIDNNIQEVLVHLNPIPSMQETLFTIQKGIILKDSEQLQLWRGRIKYPQELKKRCVEKHLSVIAGADLKIHVLRDDLVVYYNLISGIQKRIIHALYGLNGVFYQGQKNTKSILQSLEIKPANCWKRFQKVYETPGIEAANIMDSLIEEIFELVDVHLPELDISQTKLRFKNRGRTKVQNMFQEL